MLDAFPVVGLLMGANGWGAEQELSRIIQDRCQRAVRASSDDPLVAAMVAAEDAVANYYDGPEDSSHRYGAGATLLCLENGSCRFAHIGAAALLHHSGRSTRQLTAGHQLGHLVMEQNGWTFDRAYDHPHRGLWTAQLCDKPPHDWCVGSCQIETGDVLLAVTPDLSWELRRRPLRLSMIGSPMEDLAAEVLTFRPPEAKRDGGAVVVVASKKQLRPATD